MLKHTFIHIPGIGTKIERSLWENGITCWEDFIKNYEDILLSDKKKSRILSYLEESLQCLQKQDHRYFAGLLPSSELWRAYPDFTNVAYLDIETTGLSPRFSEITIIGLYDGNTVKTFINGINLGTIEKELKKYSVLVTFNGMRFDLPFIAKFLPQVTLDHLHIDLVYPMHRLGYWGGLKSIEKQLGITRESDVVDLSGFDAVRLWYEYKNGSNESLETLIKYNSADIVNLKDIMSFAYRELKKKTFSQ